MSDETPTPVPTSSGTSIKEVVVLSGWALCLLTAFIVVLAAVYMIVVTPDHQVPNTLREWGGTTLGFLFGTLLSMVKDFLGVKDK